eukprot:gene6754-9255_t
MNRNLQQNNKLSDSQVHDIRVTETIPILDSLVTINRKPAINLDNHGRNSSKSMSVHKKFLRENKYEGESKNLLLGKISIDNFKPIDNSLLNLTVHESITQKSKKVLTVNNANKMTKTIRNPIRNIGSSARDSKREESICNKSAASTSIKNIIRDETYMIQQENIKSKSLFLKLKNDNISIKGFYHVSSWKKYWREVVTEQIELRGISLLDASNELYINQALLEGESSESLKLLINSLDLKSKNKISFHYNHTIIRDSYKNSKEDEQHKLDQHPFLSEGEFGTVTALHDYCINEVAHKRKAYVYYFHNKGSCCWTDINDPVRTWRDEMNAVLAEFPSICMRALYYGDYSACGTDNNDAHYSGNFWWANCDHIAALPPLSNRFDAWAAEMFIFNVSPVLSVRENFALQCGYNPIFLHNCGLKTGFRHYSISSPRYLYRFQLMDHLTTESWLPSVVFGKYGNRNTSYCALLRSIPGQKYQPTTITVESIFN